MFDNFARRIGLKDNKIALRFIKSGASWMTDTLPKSISPPVPRLNRVIERQARLSQGEGERPIWSGYEAVSNYPRSTVGARTSDQVRTDGRSGAFYVWLVSRRRPSTIVEFGTAFGVSGMYWLAGLQQLGEGHLFTFEPNADWAAIAKRNLDAISSSYTLSSGTFEELAGPALGNRQVDLAFVDAIHTSEFVYAQFEVLKRHMAPAGIILFDDINFSEDMQACWLDIANRAEVVASAAIGERVGMIELRS